MGGIPGSCIKKTRLCVIGFNEGGSLYSLLANRVAVS